VWARRLQAVIPAETPGFPRGPEEVARILQQTLEEEAACDKKLTEIAESLVNVKVPARG
jgi:ferritin-like metal-binding protein YciE